MAFPCCEIVFYNVENLFNTTNDKGVSDGEFTPSGSKHWTEERYQKKLESLAKVLSAIKQDTLGLIGVCEVEDAQVVHDLLHKTELSSHGNYDFVHEHSSDRRGIDLALIYNYDLFTYVEHRNIPIHFDYNPDIKTRDLLIVKLKANDNTEFYTVLCHWPSSWRGDGKSKKKREYVARVLRAELDTIFDEYPLAKILVMGDFNTNPDTDVMQLDLRAFPTKDLAENALYNLSYSSFKNGYGTNVHDGQWSMVDQMLCSHSFIEYIDEDAKVFTPEWLLQKDKDGNAEPFHTYSYDKYLGGYSDHLPIYLKTK